MLEGVTAGGCSILHTLEIRSGFRMTVGAPRVLLFRRRGVDALRSGTAGSQDESRCSAIHGMEEKNGLVCLCGLLFWGNVFGERGAAFCCRSDGEAVSVAVCFAAGEGRVFGDGECFVGGI